MNGKPGTYRFQEHLWGLDLAAEAVNDVGRSWNTILHDH